MLVKCASEALLTSHTTLFEQFNKLFVSFYYYLHRQEHLNWWSHHSQVVTAINFQWDWVFRTISAPISSSTLKIVSIKGFNSLELQQQRRFEQQQQQMWRIISLSNRSSICEHDMKFSQSIEILFRPFTLLFAAGSPQSYNSHSTRILCFARGWMRIEKQFSKWWRERENESIQIQYSL